MDDVDCAFAHRHFHARGRQVDIERGTDGAHPIVAGAHPKRPLRIVRDFEKGLAVFETNDTLALAVVDPYPTVGIEIERRAVRQCHRDLLTDRRLKAGLFLLLVEIPGSAENDRSDTGGHGGGSPASAWRG